MISQYHLNRHEIAAICGFMIFLLTLPIISRDYSFKPLNLKAQQIILRESGHPPLSLCQVANWSIKFMLVR